MNALDTYGDHIIAFEAVRPADIPNRIASCRQPSQVSDQQSSQRRETSPISSNVVSPLGAEQPHDSRRNSTTKCPTPSTSALSPVSATVLHAHEESLETESISEDEDKAFANYLRICGNDIQLKDPGLSGRQVFEIVSYSCEKLSPQDREPFCAPALTISSSIENITGEKTAAQALSQRANATYTPKQSDDEAKTEHGLNENSCDLKSRTTSVDVQRPNPKTFQLQSFIADASLEILESSVSKGVQFLEELKQPLIKTHESSQDAAQWMQQIYKLHKQAIKPKTIIGRWLESFVIVHSKKRLSRRRRQYGSR